LVLIQIAPHHAPTLFFFNATSTTVIYTLSLHDALPIFEGGRPAAPALTDADDQYAVVTHGLTKRFGRIVAVDRLDLRVRRGELYGFLGPNGAGKSTTLRMLCGILEPTEGEGRVLGIDLRRDPERVKSAIGY